jgi:hypothetical protein
LGVCCDVGPWTVSHVSAACACACALTGKGDPALPAPPGLDSRFAAFLFGSLVVDKEGAGAVVADGLVADVVAVLDLPLPPDTVLFEVCRAVRWVMD